MGFRLSNGPRASAFMLYLALAGISATLLAISPAAALSKIQTVPSQTEAPQSGNDADGPGIVPMPDPIGTTRQTDTQPATSPEGENGSHPQAVPEAPAEGDAVYPQADPVKPLPTVEYDLDKLPEPVRRMHSLIVEACKSGDIEKLRPLVGSGDSMTQLSLTEVDGDPIAFLKSLSGDSGGQEILAIMEEVLEAGYVHLDAGTPTELYVWPYFFALPLDRLDARQRVELFKIVTAGDYENMKQFGAYIFYRTGITPEGRWVFFVAGD